MVIDGVLVREPLLGSVELCEQCYVELHAEVCGCGLWRADEYAIRGLEPPQRLSA